jgi:hypothetical protein
MRAERGEEEDGPRRTTHVSIAGEFGSVYRTGVGLDWKQVPSTSFEMARIWCIKSDCAIMIQIGLFVCMCHFCNRVIVEI